MRIFALTGGIGSGKSTVASIFALHAVGVVSADELARRAVEPGEPAWREIRRLWPQVVEGEGAIDRAALGKVVFSDESARARLNALVHPEVQRLAQLSFQNYEEQGLELVAYDIPLLFETGQEDLYRPVVVVSCSREQQLARIMSRDGLDRAAAEARVGSQIPLAEKARRADILIENTGTLSELEERAAEALAEVKTW